MNAHSPATPDLTVPPGYPGSPELAVSGSRPVPLTQHGVAARLDRLPVTRFHVHVLIVAALSLLFDTLDTVVTGFVLATLRPLWHFDARMIGFVSAIGLAGYLVGSFISGFAADKFGRRKTILWTLVLYSLFSASRGLSNDLVVFSILNFFTWVFVGAESCTVPPYLAELWPTRVRGKLNGWMMGFFALGVALSPIWALNIIPAAGWRWALFLTLPFALIGGLMRAGLPESPRWLLKKGRADEADQVLRGIEEKVERHSKRALPTPVAQDTAPRAEARQFRARDLLSAQYRRVTLMLWMAWLAEYGVLYTFMTFVPTLLAMEGYSIVKSFQFSVVIYGSVIPGYVLGGYLVEMFERKVVACGAFLGAAIFGTLFGLATAPGTIMAFGGLMAFCLAIGSTAIYTYTPELYPTEIRATGMGIASAWGRVGAIVLLLVFGVFAVLKGKLFVFLISDVILLLAIVSIAIFGPHTRGRRLEETSRASQP